MVRCVRMLHILKVTVLSEEQQWELTRGVCGTHGAEDKPTYGVRVRCPDGRVWAWPDVDLDPAVTARLVARLQSVQPEPCHFAELVLDYIEEQAGLPG